MNKSAVLTSDNPRVPACNNPFSHRFEVQTRFTDIDMLGHINNNVYLAMMDLAKIDYFNAVSGTRLTPDDMRMAVVHIGCDFYEPAYFTEQLTVWTTITHIGTRSVTLEQRITDASARSTKCIGTTVLAGFDPRTASGADIDPEMIARAERFEGRPLR